MGMGMFLREEHQTISAPARLTLTADYVIQHMDLGDIATEFIFAPEIGQPLKEFIHPGEWDGFTHNCEWVRGDRDRKITIRTKIKKAPNWHLIVTTQISRTEDGLIELVFERDDQEIAFDNERKMREVIEGAANGAMVVLDGEPIYVNIALAHLLGYDSIEDLVASGNTTLGSHLHPDDLAIVLERLEARRRGLEKVSRYEIRMQRKDGVWIWVQVSGCTSHWDGQEVAISWLEDVTRRKAAEAELITKREEAETANLSKSTFLATMSHEIRTPLNGVLGMAQILATRDLPDEDREMVNTIQDSSRTLMAIINDVLDLSKIEAGKMDIAPIEGDLRHGLGRLRKLFLANADEKGLQFDLDLAPEIPSSLIFDPVRMRQCVSNLISNAIKFTSEGHVKVVATFTADGNARPQISVSISDTGIGLTADEQKRLFDPFVQSDASIARTHGGTGLGLTISRQLAQKMGGDIAVTSEKGKGSTFTLTFNVDLPASTKKIANADDRPTDQSHKRTPQDSQKRKSLRGRKILLVDDNEINRKVASLFLAPHGVVVTEAENGKLALERLREQEFDLVLMDAHMPVMDGPQALKAIRQSGEAWQNIPVIALTADAMREDRERYLAMGMDGHVAKPIDPDDLEQSIVNALAGAQGTVEHAAVKTGT